MSAVTQDAGPRVAFDAKALAAALSLAGKVTGWCAPTWAIGLDEKARQSPPLVEIAVQSGRALIRSANFDRQITVALSCEGDDFTVVLPMPQLLSWLERTGAGVQCVITRLSDAVLILAGRQRITLRTWPSERYVPRREPAALEFETSAAMLSAGLAATIAVPRDDAQQPARGGVLIHGPASALGFVAADEHRIHEMTTAGADVIRLIIPRDAARLVGDMFAEAAGDVSVCADERSASFSHKGMTISTTMIDAPAVLSDEQFDRDVPFTLVTRADTLLADLELVATVADSKSRDVTLNLGPRCHAEAASNGTFGGRNSGEIELQAIWSGPALSIVFALRPVRDALLTFGQCEIHWHMNGPRDPTIITSPTMSDRRALVAPFLPTSAAQAA